MTRTPVQSSAVKSLGYENGIFEVEFNSGHTYQYTGITQQQFDELMALPSKGGMVRMLIAGATTSTRIEAEPKPEPDENADGAQ